MFFDGFLALFFWRNPFSQGVVAQQIKNAHFGCIFAWPEIAGGTVILPGKMPGTSG